MKKFLALLIAVCLAFAVFTGCNQSAAPAAEDKTAEDIRRYAGLPTLAMVPVENYAEEQSRRSGKRTGGDDE